MWIFTRVGFFNIVENAYKPGELIVKARVRSDMDRLRERYMPELGPTTFHKNYDYPYRAYIDKSNFAVGIARISFEIDYPKFKPVVSKELSQKHDLVALKVWSTMISVEEDPTRIQHYFNKHHYEDIDYQHGELETGWDGAYEMGFDPTRVDLPPISTRRRKNKRKKKRRNKKR